METTTTKDILRKELSAGSRQAAELLYNRYSGMLFSYVLQFVPERKEAEDLLVSIFSLLATRLEEACQSNLSVYCWMQIESRKIILEYFRVTNNGISGEAGQGYFSLLTDASSEHQWVFREMFVYGRPQRELALQANKDVAAIDQLFKECLLIIRKKLA